MNEMDILRKGKANPPYENGSAQKQKPLPITNVLNMRRTNFNLLTFIYQSK